MTATTSVSGARPRVGIGIDTGGTFTDAVAVDLTSGVLLAKAKRPTTREDLATGIRNALSAIQADLFDSVELVSLSTTLATNAVVEGKGARVGLIIAVPDPATFELPASLPASEVAVIAGAHSPDGRLRTALDADAAAREVGRMARNVDAFAVSTYFSVANSEHEDAIRSLIADACGAPVVCGHQLSQQIGMVERATTAALNARLLPLVRDLLDAVRSTLDSLGIDAPLMVVKGDGSLTAEAVARQRPVETVLSGPAASVVGACRLSGLASAIVADMGGTTTDIAVVSGGMPEVSAEGALVGGWRTRVQALDVRTVGLGGDSRIRIDAEGAIRLGPDRAMPLCTAAERFPEIACGLERLAEAAVSGGACREPLFYTSGRRAERDVSSALAAVLALVEGRAVHAAAVVEAAGPFIDLDDLVLSGELVEIAITPSDVLAAAGELAIGDAMAAALGVSLLADASRTDATCLVAAVRKAVGARLALEVAARALADDRGGHEPSAAEISLLEYQLGSDEGRAMRSRIGLGLPLVAVGAPVAEWFPGVRRLLDAEPVIPEHAEVANAFGALAGRVLERSEARVKAELDESFAVITPSVRESFGEYSAARRRAEELATQAALAAASAAGAPDASVSLSHDEVVAKQSRPGEDVVVELTVVATASGPPFL
ncbi:MAG TPA: hydantoinase/oxoprolinase family protein [Coriobacteriia bacterium]|nr:hydantoinase/oxoprolinase family protein [Coriobacteriia bacterium]